MSRVRALCDRSRFGSLLSILRWFAIDWLVRPCLLRHQPKFVNTDAQPKPLVSEEFSHQTSYHTAHMLCRQMSFAWSFIALSNLGRITDNCGSGESVSPLTFGGDSREAIGFGNDDSGIGLCVGMG